MIDNLAGWHLLPVAGTAALVVVIVAVIIFAVRAASKR